MFIRPAEFDDSGARAASARTASANAGGRMTATYGGSGLFLSLMFV